MIVDSHARAVIESIINLLVDKGMCTPDELEGALREVFERDPEDIVWSYDELKPPPSSE